jgi:opacity protein-like surface antigen
MAASAASSQPLSVGLKGGVPLADALKVTDGTRYFSDKAPYVIGPAFEVRLPLILAVEADVLYRRLQYGSAAGQAPASASSRTSGQAWEFPLLAKYRFPGRLVRPYVSAGLSFRRLARFEQRTTVAGTPGSVERSDEPQELTKRFTLGPTLGAGLELRVPFVRISSEIRYTRWSASSFKAAPGGLVSQLNQADFLLGIAF